MEFQKKSIPTPRGKGVLEAKILEAKYEGKLEFPGGRGVQNKKISMEGVWIFSGTAQCHFLFGHLQMVLNSPIS